MRGGRYVQNHHKINSDEKSRIFYAVLIVVCNDLAAVFGNVFIYVWKPSGKNATKNALGKSALLIVHWPSVSGDQY